MTPAELVAANIGRPDTHELDPHSGEVELFLDQLSKHGHIVTAGADTQTRFAVRYGPGLVDGFRCGQLVSVRG